MSEHIVISNSEVATFLKCARRHYYAHMMNVRPKQYGDSLSRGIIGHDALAAYYEALQGGLPHEIAESQALEALHPYIAENKGLSVIPSLITLLKEYFEWAKENDKFKIHAVEKMLTIPLNNGFHYGMRLDLLVEITEGKDRGEVVLIDHKFVYNFWTEDKLMMNAQIPKYIGTLNYHNIPVKKAYISQLRWREVKSNPERFRRDTVIPGNVEIRTLIEEQMLASEKIVSSRQDPEYRPLRTIDGMTCTNCPYIILCKQDLIGSDTTLLLQTEFERNEYNDSYNFVSDDAS